MRICRKKAQPAFLGLSKTCSTCAFLLVAVLLLVFWPVPESASPAQSRGPSQTQSRKAMQSAKTAQEDSANKQSSLADAARKANADKNKPKSKHVFTNDDLSNMGGGISVVGNGSSGGSLAANQDSSAGLQGKGPATPNEAYWRERTRAIRDQIAGVDQQIDKVKQEIAKSGPAAFDPTTGLTQNVIVLHDRNAELQRLQDREQNLEKQLEDLADEGRKAGADPGWFR